MSNRGKGNPPPAPATDGRMADDLPLRRPTRVRWLIFALACAVSWLLYLHRYAWGVVRPAVKSEYGLSDVQLGWLDSLFNATYALGQVPGGLAGDLLGPREVLSLLIAG